jgi:7,8-dihydroneopterin aldolase/epimerase/oxygenase
MAQGLLSRSRSESRGNASAEDLPGPTSGLKFGMNLLRTRISLEGLRLFCHHGMFEEERRLGQWFSFDIIAELGNEAVHVDDALLHSVGYHDLIETVSRYATEAIFQTLETLSCRLAERIFSTHDAIRIVTIRVKKVAPPIQAIVSNVSIEITAERAEP